MLKKLLVSSLIFSSIGSHASDISLDYKGFYDRLKKVNKNHYSLINLAFYVPQTKNCKIISGKIVTEKKSYPLVYNTQQQLLLPYDEKLRADRALIQLDLSGNAQKCGIQVQIVSKVPEQKYNKSSLQQMLTEMDDLYSELQGFPMKYFSKGISGITFSFDHPVRVEIDGKQQSSERERYILKNKMLSTLTTIYFSEKPSRINPWFGM